MEVQFVKLHDVVQQWVLNTDTAFLQKSHTRSAYSVFLLSWSRHFLTVTCLPKNNWDKLDKIYPSPFSVCSLFSLNTLFYVTFSRSQHLLVDTIFIPFYLLQGIDKFTLSTGCLHAKVKIFDTLCINIEATQLEIGTKNRYGPFKKLSHFSTPS